MYKREFIVCLENHQLRIDDFAYMQNISKRALKDIKMKGDILVNGVHQTVRYRLQAEDVVTFIFPPEENQIIKEDIPLQIVYEDEYLMIIDKPKGMACFPTKSHPCQTLANAISYYYQSIHLDSTVHFVNRLDRETAGLMMIAKYREIHDWMCKDIQHIYRRYQAHVEGYVESGIIDLPIYKDGHQMRRIIDERGKHSRTYYRCLEYRNHVSLIECLLETGRTHQIRVHMAAIGHPLIGDELYDGPQGAFDLESVMIAFCHPVTKQVMTIRKKRSKINMMKESDKKMNYELEVVDDREYEGARVYHLYLPHYHYMKQHFHHNIELVYLIKGSFIAHVNGNACMVESDSLFLVNANEVHYFEMREDSEMITVLINYDILKKYEGKLDDYCFDLNVSPEKGDELKESIVIMDRYRKSNELYKHLKVQEYLCHIYHLLLTFFQTSRKTSLFISTNQLDKVQSILEYIEKHYYEELTLDTLSQEFHYSPSYLCRYFKKMCGVSLFQYVKMIQLNHAYIDVCCSHDAIITIAHRHGFVDSQALIKAFKEKYGKTPGAYRRAKGQ